ncbi:hypothetical protein GCM10010121_083150 [Streptomyces brasiliensis]|uniref:Transposase IS204/IS1001/IS1096/IS1165 DDE domain-containing protein n=1 Tax=Streptomyces brasiliensis TaxID=1954 RepID=A0A917LCE3_9ACTN|nr:hypothetical protein GCM10010121_083150 [Streptomyces brasiliensis]
MPGRIGCLRRGRPPSLPDAVQVSERWHLWRNLCDKALAEVRTHADCTVSCPFRALDGNW